MLHVFCLPSYRYNVKIMDVKETAVRLKRGTDLKKAIEDLCKEKGIDTAIVLSGVGSLYEAKFRLAKAAKDAVLAK